MGVMVGKASVSWKKSSSEKHMWGYLLFFVIWNSLLGESGFLQSLQFEAECSEIKIIGKKKKERKTP